MSKLPLIPVPAPAIDSMPYFDASDWYRQAATRIGECLDEKHSTSARLIEAWNVKSRLRLAAALSLFDQKLVERFFTEHPLPSLTSLLELAYKQADASGEASTREDDGSGEEWEEEEFRVDFDSDDEWDNDAAQFALDIVLGVSASDCPVEASPTAVGDTIGMTLHNAEGKAFVMTVEGWREQERIKASALLPNPDMVATAVIFPIASVWADAPVHCARPTYTESLTLFLSPDTLWLCYEAVEPGTYAVLAFDGHIEHQVSGIAPKQLDSHSYNSAGLKPWVVNELSESLQTIYWAPLRARHWVACMLGGTLDVVAKSARVVAADLKADSAREALLSLPGFPGLRERMKKA